MLVVRNERVQDFGHPLASEVRLHIGARLFALDDHLRVVHSAPQNVYIIR